MQELVTTHCAAFFCFRSDFPNRGHAAVTGTPDPLLKAGLRRWSCRTDLIPACVLTAYSALQQFCVRVARFRYALAGGFVRISEQGTIRSKAGQRRCQSSAISVFISSINS
jgi:hypothetical protein